MCENISEGKGLKVSGQGLKVAGGNYSGDGLRLAGDRSIHISDLLGNDWKMHVPKIIRAIEKGNKMIQDGQGMDQIGGKKNKFFASIGKSLSKAGKVTSKKLVKFINGETKFKPSDLAYLTKKGIDVANIALALDPRTRAAIPITSAIASISGKVGDELKKSGRGMRGEGILPRRFQEWIKKNKEKAKNIASFVKKNKKPIVAGTVVAGVALAGLGLALAKHLSKNPHHIAQATDISKAAPDSIDAVDGKEGPVHAGNDDSLGDAAEPIGAGDPAMTGSGKGAKAGKNPRLLVKNHSTPIDLNFNKAQKKKRSGPLVLSGEGASMKKIGSGAEVFHGLAMKTSGGRKKDDFVLNKYGKVVSRKQSEAGKKAYARNNLAQYRKSLKS